MVRKDKKLYKKISIRQEHLIAFSVTFIVGLYTHFYMLTNKISFYDDISALFHTGGTYSLGRWFLGILSALVYRFFGGIYSMPWLNGTISLFFISLAAVMVVDLFSIHNKILIGLISALMVVFPVVTTIFAYMFTAPYYFFALLLSVLSVWCIYKVKYGYVLFCIFNAFAMGIYQAFLPVTVTLLIMLLVIETIFFKKVKHPLYLGILYFINLVLSYVLYYIINRIVLIVKNVELKEYQGLNSLGNVSIDNFFDAIINAYSKYFSFFVKDFLGVNNSFWIKGIYILCAISFLIMIIRSISELNYERKIVGILYVCFLPAAIEFIYIMALGNENTFIHGLMIYSIVFILILTLVLLDKQVYKKNGMLFVGLNYGIRIGCAGVIVFYIYLANMAYLQDELLQSQVDTWCTSFITQIKMTEGFKDEYSIVFVQDKELETNYYAIHDETEYLMNEFSILTCTAHSSTMNSWINNYSFMDYLRYRGGFNTDKIIDYEDAVKKQIIDECPEIDDMPCYPDDGSIQVIDQKVFVKFTEY